MTKRHAAPVLALLLALPAVPARSADDAPSPAAPAAAATPRAAMQAFLTTARAGEWTRAASYLDLQGIPEEERADRGPRLARRLKAVLDRMLRVDLARLSDEPEGARDDGLPPDRERVGTIDAGPEPVDVLLERVRRPDGTRGWQIAGVTVARVPALHEALGGVGVVALLPDVLVEHRVLELALWQWIGLAALALLALVLAWGLTALGAASLRSVARRAAVDEELVSSVVAPARAVGGLLLFSATSYALRLPVPAQAIVNGAVTALTILAVAWLFLRLADVLARGVERRFAARGQHVAISVVPLGRRSAKAFVLALAVIALLQNFGFNVTGLLAGLGIGGLAVALAAQKTVENLFGGVTLIADQPVRVGEFCRFGDRVGLVEEIGLRSTRVRTLDRTVVTVPNAEFASLQLENFARRDRFWLQTMLGLRYETTPDQLRHVLVELKRLLLAHPKVDRDPARARFVGFGAYSLDVEIFAYVLTADVNEFLAVREDIYLRIMDVVAASGTGFAFPSQTIYAAADGGLDRERARAAETRVRQWRAEQRLCLPDVPPDVAAALDDTLDYPPVGSACRGPTSDARAGTAAREP
jgi:MscS family membrane protein